MAAVGATTMGATTLEKHITLDRARDGPDLSAWLDPSRFTETIRDVRTVQDKLGIGRKSLADAEPTNAPLVRGGLEASRVIGHRDVIVESMLAARRPATGQSAMRWFDESGRPANRDYQLGARLDPAVVSAPH